MPDDKTLKEVFDHAKKPSVTVGENITKPTVFVTFVRHFASLHPPGQLKKETDMVQYAQGEMKLSSDKKTLSGEYRIWRNVHTQEEVGFFDRPPLPEDAFADQKKDFTVKISVSDTGKLTCQNKIKGASPWDMPPITLNASYVNGLFVENDAEGGSVTSVSFTLGEVVPII